MLLALEATLSVEVRADHCIIFAAVTLGWFLCSRISELLGDEGLRKNYLGFRGCDVIPYLGNTICKTFREADRLLVTIVGSKTDQARRGESRRIFPSNHPRLCALKAMQGGGASFPRTFSV